MPMNRIHPSLILSLSFLATSLIINASEEPKNWGKLSGSFESNTIIYQEDSKTGAEAPSPIYGSHNYLTLNYNYNKWSAGIQLEYIPQVLEGYEKRMQGLGMPTKFVSYNHQQFSVTVGDYYEQLGSGLVLRLWEDRQLGINNSALGARATFNTKNQDITAKVMFGIPRNYLRSEGAGYKLGQNFFDSYSDTKFYAADVSLSLLDLINLDSSHRVSVETSGLYRFANKIPKNWGYLVDPDGGYRFNLNDPTYSYSLRMSYEFGSFSLKGEYAFKSEDIYLNPKTYDHELKSGNAQLVELNYALAGFTAAAAFRRLENMDSPIYYSDQVFAANTMNYLPALAQMQTYLLATHHPYSTLGQGEIGGQLDLFYRFKRNSFLGGRYGMKVHLNASCYYALEEALSNYEEDRLAYQDLNLSIERSWNKKFKSNLFYSHQKYSPDKGNTDKFYTQDIVVADLLYELTRKISLRGELQYLFCDDQEDKDWMAGVLEANFSPHWSIYISDMYNHGNTKVHYYSVGVNYTKGIARIGAVYGRNREGMVCSGGVCRMQPAYTGGNIQLSLIF